MVGKRTRNQPGIVRVMKGLVANLGSTSFKYRLFDMADERQLARGGIERIGSGAGRGFGGNGGGGGGGAGRRRAERLGREALLRRNRRGAARACSPRA